ncbi:aldo/keto reductase [Vibrio sp. SCSIO 43136]|uniref:aldo/keto reductase n=1 Tax=Vibrio sp. SCSIO 43136 TaxID=2819101 RepID=UPI0020759959|nr:aldo/keto reductase [Vibrio sp. SCSIO 43136]USD67598.1 aldo/keto reductase [Vibrio sp. SCSIO 43136]
MTEKLIPLSHYLPNVSQLAYGCMGLGGGWNDEPVTQADVDQTIQVIETALDSGINLFDHADIYTFGKAEQAFGQALTQRPELRGKMFIQSKCGIRFEDSDGVKRYDFSADWVTQSVENILQRLQCGYLDILLLHRPDPLMELSELVPALKALHAQGKVKFFGVSNMNAHQIAYLQAALEMPIVVNQLEMSLEKHSFATNGIMPAQFGVELGTLEHCMAQGIQLQSWGSLAQGRFSNPASLDSPDEKLRKTAEYVFALSAEYQVSPEAIVLAFLTRHPAGIQPVIGTTNLDRIRACSDVSRVSLSREHWYGLLERSLGHEVP